MAASYPPMAYNRSTWLLIETSVFTRQITELLDDDEYRQFQARLADNPALGPIIRGGGGIRKARVGVGQEGKAAVR